MTFRRRFNVFIEKGAKIQIGENCFFNNDCSLNAQEEIQTEQQDTIDAENTSYNTQVPIDENSSYVTSKKLSIDELQQLRTEFANMQFEQTTEEQSMIR